MEPRPSDPDSACASRDLRAQAGALFVVFVIPLAVYAATLPRTVTLEDSGEFISVALSGGIAHPPGYPAYVLAGRAFAHLPIDPPAVRIHLVSAVAGAGACVALYLCVWLTTRARAPALLAAGLLAFSATFWSQAVIAEVYTLHALSYLTVLALCLRLHRDFEWRTAYAAAFCFGLGLSNHWPLMLLGAGAFALLLARHAGRLLARGFRLLGLVALGLTPYLQLWWGSRKEGAITAWGPLSSFSELGDYVVRARYVSLEQTTDASLSDTLQLVEAFARAIAHEWTPLLALLLPIGAWALRRRIEPLEALALAWAFLASSVGIHAFVRWPFDDVHREAYLAYQIVPFGIAAFVAGSSLLALDGVAVIPAKRRRAVSLGLAGALVALCGVANFGANDLRNESLAHDYALAVLESLPPNAQLVVHADMDTGPIAYARLVEGVRPDITVYSYTGYLFAPRLADSSHPGWQPAARSALAKIAIRDGRIFDTDLGHSPLADEVFTPEGRTLIRSPFAVRDHGLFQQIGDDPVAVDDELLLERAIRILDTERDGGYSSHWLYLKHLVLGKACRTLIAHDRIDHPVLREVPECMHALALARSSGGAYVEASELLSAVLETDLDAPASQRARRYNDFLLIELRRLGLMRETSAYQQLADRVLEGIRLDPTCDNALLPNLLTLAELRPIELPRDELIAAFGRCPRLALRLSKPGGALPMPEYGPRPPGPEQ